MRKRFFILVTMLIIVCVTYPCSAKSYVQAKVQTSENFDQFFKKFNADKAFQTTRVVFPYRVITVDDDDKRTTKFINKTGWQHINLLDKHSHFIIKKKPKGTNEMEVAVQVADTGFTVVQTYRIDQGVWKLVSMTDYSD